MLLDRGADPNVYYLGGNESIHYTALTSVIGRGEEQALDASRGARARGAAARTRRGAVRPAGVLQRLRRPCLASVLADDDLVWLLELIYRESMKRGRQADWADPDWKHARRWAATARRVVSAVSSALTGNYLRIADWALSHGANPNPPRASDPRTPQGTLYEQAVSEGSSRVRRTARALRRPRDVRRR